MCRDPTTHSATMSLRVARRTLKRSAASRQSPAVLAEGDDHDAAPVTLPKLFGGGTTIHTESNHVFFSEAITPETAFDLIKELRTLDAKLVALTTSMGIDPPPIILHITSNGGCLHSAWAVVDAISALTAPVHTVCEGFVASAGTVISASGAKRFIAPNAYVLIHQLSSGAWGKLNEVEESVTNLRKMQRHLERFYVEHTKLSKAAIEKQLKKDTLWSAAEAIKKGLVDELWKGGRV